MGDHTIGDFGDLNDTIRLFGFAGINSDSDAFEGHSAANNNLTLGFGSEGSLTFNTTSGTPELTGVFDWS
jgi:hypothetical protein